MNHNCPENAEVLKVLSRQQLYGKWFVEILYTSYGRNSTTDLMFATQAAAANVQPGYRFIK